MERIRKNYKPEIFDLMILNWKNQEKMNTKYTDWRNEEMKKKRLNPFKIGKPKDIVLLTSAQRKENERKRE